MNWNSTVQYSSSKSLNSSSKSLIRLICFFVSLAFTIMFSVSANGDNYRGYSVDGAQATCGPTSSSTRVLGQFVQTKHGSSGYYAKLVDSSTGKYSVSTPWVLDGHRGYDGSMISLTVYCHSSDDPHYWYIIDAQEDVDKFFDCATKCDNAWSTDACRNCGQ